MFKHILIVCTGNICRSPMAEAMLRQSVPKSIHVSSAGVAAVVNAAPTAEAQAVMRAHDYDVSGHRARQALPLLLRANDLILTLDQTHSDWICSRYPQLRGRVHKLLKWHEDRDVEDPYGMPQSFFEHTYADLELGIADWLPRLGL